MIPDEITLTDEDPRCAEAEKLIRALRTDIMARYPGDDGTGNFRPEDVLVPGGAFVIAWCGDVPVGCGALRPAEEGVGEIKRMYVDPNFRGKRIAQRILEKLEAHGRAFRYQSLKLETGTAQPEAIRLYERCGYTRIPCYGMYADWKESVCYAKPLTEKN